LVKPGRFHLVDSVEDFTEVIKQAISKSSPMNDSFVCFEYQGGCGKVIQRLCNKDFFEAVVVPYVGSVGETGNSKYIWTSQEQENCTT
jgi:hypothetical protein